tara:strand:- start:358 stop:1860 length:1503 start_codon:yes stop_codon:yes gene_type:complete
MNKLISVNKLKTFLKNKKKKAVMCHGVFDFLHSGHIDHFYEAKKISKGCLLIVSLTDDKYVLKGSNRPIYNLNDRIKILSSLSVIDFIVVNQSITAVDILKNIRPDYYCKGPDYKQSKNDITGNISLEKNIVEKYGGKLVFTSSPTKSSSNIINKNLSIYDKKQKETLNYLKKKKFDIQSIFEKFNKLKVLIVGEIIIDEYIFCEALGKSGKESILTFRNLRKEKYSGGSLAIANHISELVSKIDVVSYSNHKESFFKLNNSRNKNIKLKLFKKTKTNTILKTRYIDHLDNRKFMGIYDINDDKLSVKEEKKVLGIIKNIKDYDLVIVSDYGHGLITKRISSYITKNSKFLCVNAQVNSSNLGYHSIRKYKNFDCLVINGLELRHEKKDRYKNIIKLADEMKKEINSKNIIVTQGRNGAFMIDSKSKLIKCPGFATKVIDKVGSGDALLAIASIFLRENNDKALSLFASSIAAAQSVETIGNSLKLNKLNLLKSINYMLK